MPQINLLYPTQGKKMPKTKLAFALPKIEVDASAIAKSLAPALTPLIVVLICASLGLFYFSNQKANELAKIDKKATAVKIDPQEALKFKNQQEALEKKISLLEELSSHEFFWVDKMDDLSDCLPRGVWLNDLSLNKKKITQEVAKGKNEESEQTILTIKGSAIAQRIEDAVSYIGEFVNALKQKPSFSKDFSEIKLNAIYKGTIGKSDVMNFELVCLLR